MLRGEEPNKGACFVHRISAGWDPTKFEILSKDGCDMMQFDATGTLLAVLGKNVSTVANIRPTYLSFWDFTVSPQYINYVEIPRKARPSNTGCRSMVWSHSSDRIAMTFIKKIHMRQTKVKDTSTDLVIIDSRMCTLSRVFHLPFIATCMSFIPSSSDRLLASDGSGCMMTVIDIKEGTVTDISTRMSFYIPEYNLPAPPSSFDVSNEHFSEYSLTAGAKEKLDRWMSAHIDYSELTFTNSSMFITISGNLANQFEPESSVYRHGYLLAVQDDKEQGFAVSLRKQKFANNNGFLDDVMQQIEFPDNCFADMVYMMHVDDRHYTVLLISSMNAVVLSLSNLSIIWSLHDTLASTVHKDIILIGGGFVPEIQAVKLRQDGVINEAPNWNMIITFSSKDDFGFAVIMLIIDLNNAGKAQIVEEINVPKNYGLSHLECCKHSAVILAQSSGSELFYLKKSLTTDFAGSMYPSGFKIMKTVKAYMEKEDELDKVVQNENMVEGVTRVVSESFMKNVKPVDNDPKDLRENDLSVSSFCTVIGDTNVDTKQIVTEDVEVDIFTKSASENAKTSPESVIDIVEESSRPSFTWTTEDFQYFFPNESSTLIGSASSHTKKSKSESSTRNRALVRMNAPIKLETNTLVTSEVSSSSSIPGELTNDSEGKLCIDDLLPIPTSVRSGQFIAKIMKEKKLAEDIEKNRMRKILIDDKITNFEKLYKDETVKRKERDLIRREKAKEMEEKRRVQRIEANKRKLEKKKEEKERRQKLRQEAQRMVEAEEGASMFRHNEDKNILLSSNVNSLSTYDALKNPLEVNADLIKTSSITSTSSLPLPPSQVNSTVD